MATQETMVRAVSYARQRGIKAAARHYDTTPQTIRNWRKKVNGAIPETVFPPSDVSRLTDENTRLKKYLFENVFLPTILKS